MSVAFKGTAIRVILTCKREQFESFDRESRGRHGDKVCDEMFNDMLARVNEYAQQRRLEEIMKRTKGDPMDIGQAAHASDAHWEQSWEPQYEEHQEYHVDALGKGKGGKGKGG